MTTMFEGNICPVCLSAKFEIVSELSTSGWLFKKELVEDVRSVALLMCAKCGHYMTDTSQYNKAFFDFLYPDDSTSDALRSKPRIYKEIIEFNLDYLNLHTSLKITDFGGGEGDFLKLLASSEDLHGVIDNMSIFELKTKKARTDKIKYISLDLNHVGTAFEKENIEFNYAFCINALEHLLDPRDFLKSIFRASNTFFIFIQVPAVDLLDINSPVTHLHPSHIHYFSLENLVFLMNSIGFKVMRVEIKKTEGVPLLKAIGRKTNGKNNTVHEYLLKEKSRQAFLYESIIECLKGPNDKVGLWGIGNEFRELFRRFSKIGALLNCNQLLLIDSSLKNKRFAGSVILPPEVAKNTPGLQTVFILPKAEVTRRSIKCAAFEIGYRADMVNDPYELYSLNTSGI